MALFTFKAVDGAGNRVAGTHEAASREIAVDQLAGTNVFVTSIAENAAGKGGARFQIPFMPIASSGDLVLFYRRLTTLAAADIPLVESLTAISNQMENQRFRAVLLAVKEDVQQGKGFSDSIARHPNVFPEIVVSMIRVGETGGILPAVLDQLADFTEKDSEIRSEVRTAMIYPVGVLTLAVGTVILLLLTVIPKLAKMFEGMRITLPLPTRILLATSHFVHSYGILLLIAIIAAAFALLKYLKTPAGRERFDRIKLRAPLFGTMIKKVTIARFARSLGSLMRGGVPLMEGLSVVDRVLDNVVLSQAVRNIQERVRKGESMARSINREPLFPDMVRYMVASGEDSGKLDEMLFKVAHIYELESRNAIRVVLSLMSPLLLICVAGIVGFIAFAMLLPIFQINQMIH